MSNGNPNILCRHCNVTEYESPCEWVPDAEDLKA